MYLKSLDQTLLDTSLAIFKMARGENLSWITVNLLCVLILYGVKIVKFLVMFFIIYQYNEFGRFGVFNAYDVNKGHLSFYIEQCV